jgi:transposase-like protein
MRRRALELFEAGLGQWAVAGRLGLSRDTVRQWHATYKAAGAEVLLSMGASHRQYDQETKVAAARAVVELGRDKAEVMREMGIASRSPLEAWCRSYREGGAGALAPRPKGRPKGGAPRPAKTREQELEEQNRKLLAQVAYLKKSIALKAARLSETGRRPR